MARIIILIVISTLHFERGLCAPRFSDSLQNVTTYAGEDASFTCTLEFPDNKFTYKDIAWKKNEEVIASDVHTDKSHAKYQISTTRERRDDGVIVIHKTLLFQNIEMNDAGLITCYLLHQQHVMTSAWLRVHRKILPIPECNHNPKVQQLGNIVTTECKTESGEPPLILRMYRVKPTGETILLKEGHQSLDQLRLEFNINITRENVADLIVCEASISGLRGLETCTTDLLADVINQQTTEQEVRVVPLNSQPTLVGETACFLCNVYNREDVHVIWSVDSRPDGSSNVSRQYQYCFKDMQLRDNGKIVTCTISNGRVTASSSARINVIERPPDKSGTANNNLMPTPELSMRVDNPADNAHKGNTHTDLTSFLIVSFIIIIIILVMITIHFVLRSRRTRGGCLIEDFARLSTISDKEIDQQYQSVGIGDDDNGDESGDNMLIRQRKLSDETETDEHKDNESETSM